MLKRLWQIAEAARATWEWWGLLAWLGIVPGVPIVLGVFEGQPLSVLSLYVVVAIAFWIVLAIEGRALLVERKRRRIARLMALRADGVQILNRRVHGDGAILHHRGDVDDWDRQVTHALKEVGAKESDIGWFITLGLLPARFDTGNEMYDRWQNILAEKLERLLVIAQRLENSSS